MLHLHLARFSSRIDLKCDIHCLVLAYYHFQATLNSYGLKVQDVSVDESESNISTIEAEITDSDSECSVDMKAGQGMKVKILFLSHCKEHVSRIHDRM